jgi:hypothetical protein
VHNAEVPGCVVLWLAFCLAVFGGGMWFLHRAVKLRSGPSWLGAILLLGPLVWYALWLHRTDVDVWSPSFASPAIHGRWTHGRSTLEIFANGTFRIDAHGEAARRVHLTRAAGRWELDAWNLTLHPGDGYPRRLRVVVSNGEYRLIEAPEGFDTWPRWTGFNRSPASPAPERE